jgi:molybdopterin/thiamine biosynthesis adenylyltransferase
VSQREDRDHEPGGAGVRLRPGQLGAIAGRRYRLRPSIEVFSASSGDLYLLRPGEAEDLVIREASRDDHMLVRALAGGGGSLGDLQDTTGLTAEDVAAKLDALLAAGVADRAPEDPVALPEPLAVRFDRQLPYLAEHGDPGAAQLRLRGARVAILGCGGLGTWALGALASTGVGGFVLVDHDVVDLSNLNRQLLYGVADVGAPKAERAADWLRRFDPDVDVRVLTREVRSAADVATLLDGVDALVQTADWPPYRIVRWVDEACRIAGVPYIIGGQRPPLLKVGPTFVPDATACFTCHETALARDFPLYPELARQRDETPARSITLGPASGIAGTLIASEVMHLLLGRDFATAGRALLVDLRTLTTRWEAVERQPDCPACA